MWGLGACSTSSHISSHATFFTIHVHGLRMYMYMQDAYCHSQNCSFDETSTGISFWSSIDNIHVTLLIKNEEGLPGMGYDLLA